MRRIEVLDKGALPNGGILRSDDFASITQSDDIIRNTQAWAAARRREIETTLEEEREAALAKAYSDGVSSFAEARDQYERATTALSDKLDLLLRKGIHRLLSVWPPREVIRATLEPLLGDLRRQADVRLRVHPNQVASVSEFLEAQRSDLAAFTVVSDPSLEEADCVIFTQSEIITMTVPVLVDQLMVAMAEYVAVAAAAQREEFGDGPAHPAA